MTKSLKIVCAALLLGVSGLGGALAGASPVWANESAPAAEGEHGAEGAAAHAMTFVKMDPIILPIVDRNGVSQVVSLVVAIQVNDGAKADEVRTNLPRLTDAFLSDMYGTLSQKASMDHGVIRVSALKARLLKISQKLMGDGSVNDVLLQVVQQRPA